MSQYPQSEPGQPQPARKPKKGWFGRNWWWFIPLIVIAPFVCCCGSCGGLMYFGLQQIENLPPYQDTLADAQSNPAVQAELGTPIENPGVWGTLTSGGQIDVQQTTTGGTLTAAIPISGPNGSGTLYIEASDNGTGTWTYTRREVMITGSGVTIDLMPDSSDDADKPF